MEMDSSNLIASARSLYEQTRYGKRWMSGRDVHLAYTRMLSLNLYIYIIYNTINGYTVYNTKGVALSCAKVLMASHGRFAKNLGNCRKATCHVDSC